MKQKKSILAVIFSLIFSIFFFLLPVSHVAGQVSVPSIEKLFQDNVKELSDGELFYGCIINIEGDVANIKFDKSSQKQVFIKYLKPVS